MKAFYFLKSGCLSSSNSHILIAGVSAIALYFKTQHISFLNNMIIEHLLTSHSLNRRENMAFYRAY